MESDPGFKLESDPGFTGFNPDLQFVAPIRVGVHLIFACGRYEGIDSRVTTFYQSQPKVRVHEVSIGDYVLNGGEVAALAITEAVVRLIPGVIGNPESLIEESHNEAGLVEYPTFTKPPEWRGLQVPEVLTSGNHGAIAKWRLEQAEIRSQNARGD